jgi:PIN domain nuclease of toxin-antitoxin system
VRLLLDTHALLWWLADEPTLSNAARTSIANEDSIVFVSAASVWEMSIKRQLGKLDAPTDLAEQIDRHRFDALPITIAHALEAGSLPPHHDDPFDRMLIAQAIAEHLTIVTRDSRFARYEVPILAA